MNSFLNKNQGQSNIDIAECAGCASYICFIHVLHVLYMPMDASLACWALYTKVSQMRFMVSGPLLSCHNGVEAPYETITVSKLGRKVLLRPSETL